MVNYLQNSIYTNVILHQTNIFQVKVEDEFAGKCGYNIAKLYYNVGEYQLATKYLDKFDQVSNWTHKHMDFNLKI